METIKEFYQTEHTPKSLYNAKILDTDAHAVWDPKWQTMLREVPWQEWIEDDEFFNCKDAFLEQMHNWIISSKLNDVHVPSLDYLRFDRRDSIIGTTQALDEFHWRHRGKTLRVFRGEYGYNKRVYETHIDFVPQFDHLDKTTGELNELNANDYIIISLPFAGFGDKHPLMDEVLDRADEFGIPVLIDCAWFGTCMHMEFDFTHQGITEVCFSTSKGLGCGRYRAGIRYSNYEDGMITQHNNYNHLVGSNMQLAMWMMSHFTPDHIPTRFRDMQQEVCNEYGMIPSKCMHVGMAPHNEDWEIFQLAGVHYRVGLSKVIKLYRQSKL
jgi:hypothetical protein